MKNIQKAIKRVHQIDALSKRTTILSAIHPTYKILIVLFYINNLNFKNYLISIKYFLYTFNVLSSHLNTLTFQNLQ